MFFEREQIVFHTLYISLISYHHSQILVLMKRILLYLCLLLGPLYSSGQDYVHKDKIIPPSPTSAVFAKFGDFQPNLSTGMVNIPIELYNIQVGDFNIPFTLHYTTSGITHLNQPYPLGHGWSLSPGLRITRTILGRPDDQYKFKADLTSIKEDYHKLKLGIIDPYKLAEQFLQTDTSLFDAQRDLFTLNLPTRSISFILKWSASGYQVITLGNAIKINPIHLPSSTPALIKGFEVIDDDGTKYIFGKSAQDNAFLGEYVEVEKNNNAYSTWLLKEITLPNTQNITFRWKSTNLTKYLPSISTPVTVDYKYQRSRPIDNHTVIRNDLSTLYPVIGESESMSLLNASAYIDVKMLEQVNFPTGKITLEYKNELDPFLQKLYVENYKNERIKQVDFTYGPENETESLLLKQLKIDNQIYSFQYNSNAMYPGSPRVDYWGYYNGKNNSNMVPKVNLIFKTQLNADWPLEVGSADRSVDAEKMKAMMLERIDFPTGGYSTFEYEPHQFSPRVPDNQSIFTFPLPALTYGGGLRIAKITTKASDDAPAQIKTYKYGKNEDGLANIQNVPVMDSFLDESRTLDYGSIVTTGDLGETMVVEESVAYNRMFINPLSSYAQYTFDKTPIWYNEVTEYLEDRKNVYSFNYLPNTYQDISIGTNLRKKTISNLNDLFTEGPLINFVTNYKKISNSYIPVRIDSSYYSSIFNNALSNEANTIILRQSSLTPMIDFPEDPVLTPYLLFQPTFKTAEYHIFPTFFRNAAKHVTTFSSDGVGSIVESEDYTYSLLHPTNVFEKTITNSNNSFKKIRTKYAYDFNTTESNGLQSLNMLNKVLQQETYQDSKLLKKEVFNYQLQNNTYYLKSIEEAFGNNALYEKVRIAKHNTIGKPLQIVFNNNAITSYCWGNQELPIAEFENAKWDEVFYEDIDRLASGRLGNLVIPNAYSELILDSPLPENCLHLNSFSNYIENLNLTLNKRYVFAYWAKSKIISLSTEVSTNISKSIGDWKYYETIFTATSSVFTSGQLSFNISSFTTIQGLKLYPENAFAITLTYKPLVGITSKTDPKGMTEYYKHDSYQRLQHILDGNGNILKSFCYNYKGELADCFSQQTTYFSVKKEGLFTKNNCPSGQEGNMLLYTVPAGKYSSLISQQDADLKAQNDLDQNGQNYANSNGTCTTPVAFVNVEIQKYTDWNGTISRIQFYKDGSSSPSYEVFPSNSGSSETISVPEGEYSSVKFTIDGSGTPYNGMLSIVSSNPIVCTQIGMSSTIITLPNVKFTTSGSKLIVVAEYCMN